MKRRLFVSALAICAIGFFGCDDGGGDNTTDTEPTTDSGPPADTGPGNAWDETIKPILTATCEPCHATGGIAPQTFFLSDVSVLDNDAVGGTYAACAGQKVSTCIHTLMANGAMPLGGGCPGGANCPSQADIDAVKAWVDAGAEH